MSEELFRIFPVFILIDVSASMAGGAIEAVNESLPAVKDEVKNDPTVGEIARFSIHTFSDGSRTVVPLSDIAFVEIPRVMVEGGTNFEAAFRSMRSSIEAEMSSFPKGTPVYRPVLFFMSDGLDKRRDKWEPALASLQDRSWKFSPEIVAFGFGAEVDETALRQISPKFAFKASDSSPARAVNDIFQALIGSIRTTSNSFADPEKEDGLYVEAPSENFAKLAPFEI